MRRLPVLPIALVLALAAALPGCGKKGPPDTVPGGNYPTSYPQR